MYASPSSNDMRGVLSASGGVLPLAVQSVGTLYQGALGPEGVSSDFLRNDVI